MPEEFKVGCQRPPIKKPEAAAATDATVPTGLEKEAGAMIKVGKSAPDFTAPGYLDGKFANYSLSEFKGKWVLLCFYPGDFTFV